MIKTYTKEEKKEYFQKLRDRWSENKKNAENDKDAKLKYEAIVREFPSYKISFNSFYFTLQEMVKQGLEGIPYIDTKYFNNTRGKDDIEKRALIFEALDQGQSQLLPFTEDEIRNEKELFKFDFSQYETKDPGIPSDTLVQILSFKFTNDEWKVVQEGIEYAKRQGQNSKQWFMILLGQYLRSNGLASGFKMDELSTK